MKKENKELSVLINMFNNLGYVAHHYPRKKIVSFNGFRVVNEKQALQELKDFLNACNVL